MVKKMVISGRIILIMTMLAVLLPVLATAATVNVDVSTDKESYAVGETIAVTVRMNTDGASAIDSRLYISSSTAGAASFVSGSGQYGDFFATRGVAPVNGLSGSRWHFFSGANTPAVSSSALTSVFTFQMTAETAGNTILAVDRPSSAPAAGDASVSTVLERVGAPPRFIRTYHAINPASAAITITETAAAPACTDECAENGARVCAGGLSYRECGNFDDDSCLELGAAIRRCPNNGACTDGVCAVAAAAQVCGNNVREGTEVCDGTDLAGETCASQQGEGYTGTLACKPSCATDVNGCIAPTEDEDGGGDGVVPAVDRLQQLQDDIGIAINQEAPEREGRRPWTPLLVARLAQLLRDFFS